MKSNLATLLTSGMLLLSVAVLSGCGPSERELKFEAQKAAALKADTDVRAAAAQKSKIIDDVLSFLNSAALEWSEIRRGRVVETTMLQHSQFTYNVSEESVEFVTREIDLAGEGCCVFGSISLKKTKILLPTVSPVIQVSSRGQNISGGTPSYTITLNCTGYELVKKRFGPNTETPRDDLIKKLVQASSADLSSFKTMSHDPAPISAIQIRLSEQNGPRVRQALEDLLKVHGITPSRY